MKYRHTRSNYPIVRLEDSIIYYHLKETLGDNLFVTQESFDTGNCIYFGTTRKGEKYRNSGNDPLLEYWNDRGFKNNCMREFFIGSISDAVEYHRKSENGTFIKSIQNKLYAGSIPKDFGILSSVGDMGYSICQSPLIIQENVDMIFEHRYVFLDGKLVTWSSIADEYTQLKPIPMTHAYPKPNSKESVYLSSAARDRLKNVACRAFSESKFSNLIVDVAFINGVAGVIEFNDAHVGGFGLYGCDVSLIAKAVKERYKQ